MKIKLFEKLDKYINKKPEPYCVLSSCRYRNCPCCEGCIHNKNIKDYYVPRNKEKNND